MSKMNFLVAFWVAIVKEDCRSSRVVIFKFPCMLQCYDSDARDSLKETLQGQTLLTECWARDANAKDLLKGCPGSWVGLRTAAH